ncbi:uncharacterized protein LOC143975013 isoform X2 [Lithobates pipiens]
MMDRYRYFIFNQRSMVVLGILQIACTAISVICGLMDGAFRKESSLGKTRVPLWAGMIMAVPGLIALFSSQKKNPVLVNALIVVSVFSCFTTLILIVYACLTLAYGEDDYEVFSHTPVHIVHTEWLHPEHEPSQTIELVCTFHDDERIFNSPAQFTETSVETEESFSQPPPYLRFS